MKCNTETLFTQSLLNSYSWIINPVGRIVEVDQYGNIGRGFCSGFNIGGGYFLTAGHCLGETCYSSNEGVQMVAGRAINFGYQDKYDPMVKGGTLPSSGKTCSVLRVIEHGYCDLEGKIDYAILRLAPASAAYGEVTLTNKVPQVGSGVVVVHHPYGKKKAISFGQVQGYSLTSDYLYFNDKQTLESNYTACTSPGSSGSPVGYPGTEEVFAVHVKGSVDPQTKQPDQESHFGVTIFSLQKKSQCIASLLGTSSTFFPSTGQSGSLHVANAQQQNYEESGGCCSIY
jgi:hypothetical protein